mgnify:CR=1 FL=1
MENLFDESIHHACCLKYSLGGSVFGEGMRGKVPLSSLKNVVLKWKEKFKASSC